MSCSKINSGPGDYMGVNEHSVKGSGQQANNADSHTGLGWTSKAAVGKGVPSDSISSTPPILTPINLKPAIFKAPILTTTSFKPPILITTWPISNYVSTSLTHFVVDCKHTVHPHRQWSLYLHSTSGHILQHCCHLLTTDCLLPWWRV